jgi:hypothetical protein
VTFVQEKQRDLVRASDQPAVAMARREPALTKAHPLTVIGRVNGELGSETTQGHRGISVLNRLPECHR